MLATGQYCGQTAFVTQHVCYQSGILYIQVNLIINYALIIVMQQLHSLVQAGIGT